MRPFSAAIALIIISSLGWALWSFLIDLVDASGKANFVGYMTIVEIVVVLLGAAVLLFYLRYRGRGIERRERRLFVLPVLAGLGFGVGSIIFYSLLGGVDYPFVTSMQMATVIPFAFIICWVTRQRIGRLYVLGTAVAFLGFLLQVVGLYGTNLSASLPVVAGAIAVAASYTLGYYFEFRFIYAGLTPMEGSLLVGIVMLGTVFLYGLAGNGYSAIMSITPYQIGLCVAIGVSVIVAGLTSAYALRVIRKERAWKLNIVNVLSNLELVWVIIFTAFFLSIALPEVIIGMALVFLGMLAVSRS